GIDIPQLEPSRLFAPRTTVAGKDRCRHAAEIPRTNAVWQALSEPSVHVFRITPEMEIVQHLPERGRGTTRRRVLPRRHNALDRNISNEEGHKRHQGDVAAVCREFLAS